MEDSPIDSYTCPGTVSETGGLKGLPTVEPKHVDHSTPVRPYAECAAAPLRAVGAQVQGTQAGVAVLPIAAAMARILEWRPRAGPHTYSRRNPCCSFARSCTASRAR